MYVHIYIYFYITINTVLNTYVVSLDYQHSFLNKAILSKFNVMKVIIIEVKMEAFF